MKEILPSPDELSIKYCSRYSIYVYILKNISNLKNPWIFIISWYLQTTIILWSPSFFVQNMTSMEWYFLIIFVDIISDRKILNIIKDLYLFLIVFQKINFNKENEISFNITDSINHRFMKFNLERFHFD